MISKEQKKEIIQDLNRKIIDAKAIVFADYSGLRVSDFAQLRAKAREIDIEIKVAKKTLFELALKKANYKDISIKKLEGQIGIAFGFSDEVSPAKILFDFSKTNEKLKLLGGILEKKFIDAAQIIFLAKLPSKQQLLAQIAGGIAAPMSGFINILYGNLRNLIFVLNTIKSKKQ